MTQLPPFPRRALGETFRQLRLTMGWSVNRAATEFGVSRDKIQSLELGNTKVSIVEIRGICQTYGTGRDVEHELIALSESRSKHGWMEQFDEGIPRYAQKFVAMERRASRMLIYENEFVTGLFQTETYMRATFERDRRLDSKSAAAIVRSRLTRQREFAERDHPSAIHLIINEHLLRRVVGSREIMAEQLERLQESHQLPHVDIKVLPFEAGAHASMAGSYTVLDFPDTEPSVVYMESRDGCRYETGPKVVELYRGDHNETDQLTISLEEFADDRTVA